MSYPDVKGRLDSVGIRIGLARAGTLRLVTHRDVDESDVDRLLGALK
jgi:threonine aldolase